MKAALELAIDAMLEARGVLAQYVRDASPCDHAVGICICGDERTLERLGEAIVEGQLALAEAEQGEMQ